MELKSGYKQTEVGVIPQDWEVNAFGDVASVRKQKIDPRKTGTHPFCIELEHMEQGSGQLLGNTETMVDSSIKSVFYKDDILFGKLRAYLRKYWLSDRDGVASTEIWPLVAKQNKASPGYIFQIIQTDGFIEAANMAYGTHMPRTDWNVVKNYSIPLPPLPEQRSIAATLGDMDALIRGLDQLIAKKRDLKQAAMQQLLTGKLRLPGFGGEWEVKRLGDIASLYRENVIPANFPDQLFVHYSLPAFDVGKIPVVELGSAIGSNKFRVSRDAVLLSKLNPRIPRVWAPSDIALEAISSTEFLVLKPKENISRSFLYVVCSSASFCEQMELSATGTTGSHQRINPKDALNIEFAVPTDSSEQTAIATVFADMDAEIAALEQRRDKTRDLKQGMMQELLTGRTRLL